MTIGNFSEKVGTSRTDRLKAKDLQIAYGLGDDDLLKSARGWRHPASNAPIPDGRVGVWRQR
jgi:hypothetical protein